MFLLAWSALLLAKLLLAAHVPLFVDEAFYAWEGRHPAWAYSEVPGATPALARIGPAFAPGSALALRAALVRRRGRLGRGLPGLADAAVGHARPDGGP